MSNALATAGGHLRALGRGTLTTWWRCLPAMLVGLSLGWLGQQASLVAAASISSSHPWLAVAITALGFASQLVGYLYALRSIGRTLAVNDELLTDEQGRSLLGEPMGRLVAVTLLPFLGIYAVFGQINQTSIALVTYETILRGTWSNGVLAALNPKTSHQVWVVAGALAASWLLRRVLDAIHERTGLRLFGVLTALVETFFMLVLVFGGFGATRELRFWLADRQVSLWLQQAWDWAMGWLAWIWPDLPHWLVRGWELLAGPVWHTFMAGLGEPLLWLALAALTFGSRVLSMAELWRTAVDRRPPRLRRVSVPAVPGRRARRLLEEVQATFLGDIDDKYLPTLHSLRLVLAGGASLLGAFCLLHALATLPGALCQALVDQVVGPQDMDVWVSVSPPVDLLTDLVGEPLRLALLGVTYLRCLQMVRSRSGAPTPGAPTFAAAEDGATHTAAGDGATHTAAVDGATHTAAVDASAPRPAAHTGPSQAGHDAHTGWRQRLRTRVRSGWRELLLAAVMIGLAGALVQWIAGWGGSWVERRVGIGEPVQISSAGQELVVTEIGAGSWVARTSGGQPMRTSDIFLGVNVVARTPHEQVIHLARCVLHQGGHELLPVLDPSVVTPQSGYQVDAPLVFERPRDALEGARLVCTPQESVRTRSIRVVVDLGIDADRARELASSTKGFSLPTVEEAEVIR